VKGIAEPVVSHAVRERVTLADAARAA